MMPDFPPLTPKRVRTRVGPVECIDQGAGPAVLALHGAMGGYDQSWILARALWGEAASRRVIAVSRPGYLGTPIGLGRTPEEQADLLVELLDALGIENATVAAVSAGGPSALHFAARHPDRCRNLVLVSTATGTLQTPPDRLRKMRVMGMLGRVPGLSALLRRRLLSDPERAAIRAIPDPELRRRTLEDPEAGRLFQAVQLSVFDHLGKRVPGSLNDVGLFAGISSPPFAQVLARTLVIHGTADPAVPLSHAEAVADGVPGAELMLLEDGGHLALFSHLHEIRIRASAFL